MDNKETNNVNNNYGQIVGKMASMMNQDGNISRGDLAELRRLSPDKPFTSTLWRIMITLKVYKSPHWISQGQWERRWATLMMGMAHCQGLHEYSISFGSALAEAGWTELRFVQLMRTEGEMLEKQIRRVAQFLSSKKQQANWSGTAQLLFFQSGEPAKEVRLDISRDYYRRLHKLENNNA